MWHMLSSLLCSRIWAHLGPGLFLYHSTLSLTRWLGRKILAKIRYSVWEEVKKYYCLHFSTPHILLISYWKPTLTSPWKVRRKQITIILDNKIPFILLHDHVSSLPGTEWFGGGSRFTIQADHAAHLHLNQLFHWSLRKIWSRSWKERRKREQECII